MYSINHLSLCYEFKKKLVPHEIFQNIIFKLKCECLYKLLPKNDSMVRTNVPHEY